MNKPSLIWSAPLKPQEAEALIQWGAAIEKAERERIIKLLEDYSDGELLVIPTAEISALIKGEQK